MATLRAPFSKPEANRALLYQVVGLALASLGLALLVADWSLTVGLAITPLVFVLLAGLRWARPDTFRALLYQFCGLAVASLAFGVLIAGWTVTLVFAITPLVFPLLFGLRWVVGQLARLQALSANALLGTRLSPPVLTTRGASFWSRSLNVARDPAFWKQQAHLLLSWPMALIPLAVLIWGLELVSLPVWYRWVNSNEVFGFLDVATLGETLPFAAVGLVLLVVVAYGIGPYTRLSQLLAVRLLAGEPGRRRPRRSPAETRRRRLIGLTVTSLVATSIVLACIVIWELTTPDRYFWPIWPLLALVLVVAIPGWTVLVLERDDISPRTLGSRSLAILLGVSALLEAFLIAVWAVTGGGYFWPIWPALGLALLAIAHAAVVFGRREHRIRELETTRAGAIDVQETELRRIERDLHDGAQARLVALGMSLGMAEEKLKTDPEGALLLLAEARSGARAALEDLRDLARGIHPPILTDRGLEAAITALAAHSPVPVSVTIGVSSRPPATVETAAYFVVAEALANAIKYGGAERIDVRIWRSNGTLVAEVEDDGSGGADPGGSGLTGLRQRVAALDGTFSVDSPAGGPTKVRAELPCGS
jgi:signal transduction histidine kinase